MNICIFGASGGLGWAFAKYYIEQFDNHVVILCARNLTRLRAKLDKINAQGHRIFTHPWDAEDIKSTIKVSRFLKNYEIRLDLCINAAGVLHNNTFSPEIRLGECTPEHMLWSFQNNTVAALGITQYMSPFMKSTTLSTIAHLSSKVGSINENRLGGWYAYRASKAALNMLVKTAAIDCARFNKNLCVVAVHPGTVETHLSAPFQEHVSKDKIFKPIQSVSNIILYVFGSLTPADTGTFFSWDGSIIDW
ncbi:hypothetical protein DID78_07230 [Candidatus Marinamargulisbacteria bacterium SCGC AG-343-D04]|nr:hypothetical protein DID78_07230 [Candidatus Marinamargulisbacteria bacterium SCGC AG-343-D04]